MSRKETRSTTSNQTTTNTLNNWSQNTWQDQFDLIQGMIGDGTYNEYDGPLTAGISGAETRAMDYVMGQNAGGRAGYTPTEYNPLTFENDFDPDVYVNPHAQGVTDRMTGNVMEALDRTQAGTLGNAISSGSRGGSRHGIREALNVESALDTIGDQTANINFQAWQDGLGAFTGDANRHMQAYGMNEDGRRYGYETGRQNEQQWLQNLMNVGANERSILDAGYGADYMEFLRGEQGSQQDINTQMQLLNMIPMLTNSTTNGQSTSTTKSNPGVMGVIGAAANIGSMAMGMPPGIGSFFSKAFGGGATPITSPIGNAYNDPGGVSGYSGGLW